MSINIGSLIGMISLDDQGSAAIKSFQNNLQKAGSSFSQAGTALSVGITAPLVAAAGASLMFSSKFETTMTRLVSLAGVSQQELAGVKQHILDLAPAVGVGPQALAEAMTKISSTVSDTKVALEILDMAAKGSAAGMGEASDVAGALTAIVNSYGKENITAAQAADILTKAVQDGGAEAKELAPTLSNVVPLAAQLGISFQEVAANIATVTKLGVPASEAVTQLSSVMASLLKETKQGSEALNSVGLTFDMLRKSIKDKGLTSVLIDLTQRFGENKTGLTDVFGRIEALRNVMSSAGQQTETYALELTRMNTAAKDGTALTTAFEAVQKTQAHTWNELSGAVGSAAIKFGDALAPAMTKAFESAKPLAAKIIDLVDGFSKLSQPTQSWIIGAGVLAAVVGPVLFVIGSLAQAISALIPIFVLVKSGFMAVAAAAASVALSVGIVVTGIGLLVIAFSRWKEATAKAELDAQTLGAKQDTINKAIRDGAVSTIIYADAVIYNSGARKKDIDVIAVHNKEILDGVAKQQAAAQAVRDNATATANGTFATQEYKDAMSQLKNDTMLMTDVQKSLSGSVIEAITYYLNAGAAIKDIAVVMDVAEGAVRAVDESIKAHTVTMSDLTKKYDGLLTSINKTLDATKPMHDQWMAMKTAVDNAGKTIEERMRGLSQVSITEAERVLTFGFSVDKVALYLGKTSDQIQAVKDRMEAAKPASDNYNSGLVGVGNAAVAATDKIRTLTGAMVTLEEAERRRKGGGYDAEGKPIGTYIEDRYSESQIAGVASRLRTTSDVIKNMITSSNTLAQIEAAGQAALRGSKAAIDYWISIGGKAPTTGTVTTPAPPIPSSQPFLSGEPSGGVPGRGSPSGVVNNFYVNGTATEVARVISTQIMRDLKLHRQFGSA